MRKLLRIVYRYCEAAAVRDYGFICSTTIFIKKNFLFYTKHQHDTYFLLRVKHKKNPHFFTFSYLFHRVIVPTASNLNVLISCSPPGFAICWSHFAQINCAKIRPVGKVGVKTIRVLSMLIFVLKFYLVKKIFLFMHFSYTPFFQTS
jgi:hypothetical protein